MRLSSAAVAVVGILFAAGCGGGSDGSPAPPTDQAFSFGELSGRAAISNPPVTTNSPTVVATALKGSFSTLKLREFNPSLAETRIAFSSTTLNFAQLES